MVTFRAHRATVRDFGIVLSLIEDSAQWLRTKDTDQWAEPWPNATGRDERIRKGLEQDATWLVWAYDHELDRERAVATITLEETANPIVWNEKEAGEPAGYVNRLVVDREYGGRGLGAALLNWAASEAVKRFRATWIRIDVWTGNEALHKYYERHGFERVYPDCPYPEYPSRARFKRHVDYVGDDGAIDLEIDSDLSPEPELLAALALARCGRAHPVS